MNTGTKITIYTANNIANAGKMAGLNAIVQSVRKSAYAGIAASGIQVLTPEDRLMSGGLETATVNGLPASENDIWLKTDSGTQIHIVGATVDCTTGNKIVSTPLVYRRGTVKELVQANDCDIKIQGYLFGDYDSKAFPHAELKLLNLILSDASSISVSSAYLRLFDVEKIAFKSANFNQSKTDKFNILPFELSFVEDTDYNFLVDEN